MLPDPSTTMRIDQIMKERKIYMKRERTKKISKRKKKKKMLACKWQNERETRSYNLGKKFLLSFGDSIQS